jgi:hypothetical protein
LLRLLEADLAQQGLPLAHEFGAGRTKRWFSSERLSDALLLVALTGNKQGAWRVILIDPSRHLGASRTLPGGSDNAANLEAVASIVLAAATALVEGRDVVSSPIQDVLREEEAAADHDEPTRPEDSSVERPSSKGVAEPRYPRNPLVAPSALHLALTGGGSLSTFESSIPWSPAATGSLALVAGDRFVVEAGASFHPPASFDSEYGSFALSRWATWLGAGPIRQIGDWALDLQVSVAAESIARIQTDPAPEITATPGHTSLRFGARLAGGARYSIIGPLGLQLRLFTTWHPRPIRLTAMEAREVVAEPWMLGFGAFTGLSFWL